jgi:predicted transcriptional regulator
MYIVNHQVIENKFKCYKTVANYLMEHGVPLLSSENNTFYFAETELLNSVLENAPLWIKLFCA